jgi:hypothetical protein
MTQKIKLVQGDTRPQIQVTFTDETTGLPINITGAVPRMYFRAAGSSETLSTLTGVVLDGPAGKTVFSWGPTTLNVPPGDYQGELELTFSTGDRQSVYDIVKFKVREDFSA